MLTLQRPKPERIRQILDQQVSQPLSYGWSGATTGDASEVPDVFFQIDYRRSLGRGETIFRNAINGLQQWKCFNLPWTQTVFDGSPHVGRHIAVAARAYGVWSVNCCRVVGFDPCQSRDDVWSFTVGTLPHHMAIGEENISVQFDVQSGEVYFRIHSFSQPTWLISRAFYRLIRRQQARFCHDSFQAMYRFVVAHDRVPAGHHSSYVSA